MTETWRFIPGWEGFYQASHRGEIRGIDRFGSDGRKLKGKILSQTIASNGYLTVKLCRNGKARTFCVHDLVLQTFVGQRPPGNDARHGSGGPLDNRWPENLCYGTLSENNGVDRVRDGTSNRGERCGTAKLTGNDIRAIRAMVAAGGWGIQTRAAKQYGVTVVAINKIVHRQNWAHID
jgi:hypothetical protein